jgi:hypothetical protein
MIEYVAEQVAIAAAVFATLAEETARWLSWDRLGYRLYSRVSSVTRVDGIAVA